ncbi:hypothetical protein KUCAC02_036151 [Chaenocephalus aceratus]|nr:hypothetical protein KUCAC02_036151 [Chaenocephalus aceratus]
MRRLVRSKVMSTMVLMEKDFLILDLETETYIAPRPEAVLSKRWREKDKAWMAQQKNYFTKICPDHMKNHANLGRSFLMRTDLQPGCLALENLPVLSAPVNAWKAGNGFALSLPRARHSGSICTTPEAIEIDVFFSKRS